MERTASLGLRRIALAIALAVFATLVITNLSGTGQEVTATHTPADKVVASGKALQKIDAGTAVPIMSATLRTSKPTDLIMSVTLECAILTKLWNAGSSNPNASSAATTNAQIDVWIQDDAGRVVPISSISSPPQHGSQADSGSAVTFCQREEGRKITDSEDARDGVDDVVSYHDAKTANGFNWVLLNAGSGVHTYTVMATLVDSAECTKDLSPETCSDAYIGNRTFVIEPTKMANDATVS